MTKVTNNTYATIKTLEKNDVLKVLGKQNINKCN